MNSDYPLLITLADRSLQPVAETKQLSSALISKDYLLAAVIWANQQIDASTKYLRRDDFYMWNLLSLQKLNESFLPTLCVNSYDGTKSNYNPSIEDLSHMLSSHIFSLIDSESLSNDIISSVNNSIELVASLSKNISHDIATQTEFFIASSNYILTQEGNDYIFSNLVYWFKTPPNFFPDSVDFLYRIYYSKSKLDLDKYEKSKEFLDSIVKNISDYIEKIKT
ncbi:MAG: hypothetical protein ACRCV3_05900 [Desulfovibrionaceae bacterium]